MSTMNKILVIGSSNTDMTVLSEKLPAPGQTVLGGELKMGQGGKGANQAIAAKRLGGDVTFICKLGRDVFADNAIRAYGQQKPAVNVTLQSSTDGIGFAIRF